MDQEEYEPSIAATKDLVPHVPDPDRVQWQGPLQPVYRRLRQKTMVREDDRPDEPMDDGPGLQEGDAEPGRGPPNEPLQPEPTIEDDRPIGEKRTYDEDDEEDEPVSKRSRLEYLEIFELKVSNLLKAKQNKEVRFQELSQTNKECCRKAMKKEIENNLDIGAMNH